VWNFVGQTLDRMRQLVSSFVCRQPCVVRFFSSVASAPHVAIIGSGPAGFYTAQQLLKVRRS